MERRLKKEKKLWKLKQCTSKKEKEKQSITHRNKGKEQLKIKKQSDFSINKKILKPSQPHKRCTEKEKDSSEKTVYKNHFFFLPAVEREEGGT